MTRGILIAIAIGLAAGSLDAQESQGNPDRTQWIVTPYLMFPAMQGHVGIGTATGSVNFSPGDIFSHLQVGGMLNVEVRKGRWAAALDAIYMDLSEATDSANLTVGARQGSFELAALRRVGRQAEVLVAGRLNTLEGTLTGQIGPAPVNARQSVTWVDPVVGVRARTTGTGPWSLETRADIGGFGVGSNLTWQVIATIGRRLSDLVTLGSGLRYISVDYENAGKQFTYDMDTYGLDLRLQLWF